MDVEENFNQAFNAFIQSVERISIFGISLNDDLKQELRNVMHELYVDAANNSEKYTKEEFRKAFEERLRVTLGLDSPFMASRITGRTVDIILNQAIGVFLEQSQLSFSNSVER